MLVSLSSLYCFLGATSTVSLELSMVNSTVQKGGYFELQAVKFSPSLIKDGFRGIFCGYTQEDGDLSEMTKWGFYKSPPGMKVESTLPPDYTGRVTVRNRVIMRISNAKFIDEGRIFYCKVDYQNLTTGKDLDLRKFAKLETVYGKKCIDNYFYVTDMFPNYIRNFMKFKAPIYTGPDNFGIGPRLGPDRLFIHTGTPRIGTVKVT